MRTWSARDSFSELAVEALPIMRGNECEFEEFPRFERKRVGPSRPPREALGLLFDENMLHNTENSFFPFRHYS